MFVFCVLVFCDVPRRFGTSRGHPEDHVDPHDHIGVKVPKLQSSKDKIESFKNHFMFFGYVGFTSPKCPFHVFLMYPILQIFKNAQDVPSELFGANIF